MDPGESGIWGGEEQGPHLDITTQSPHFKAPISPKGAELCHLETNFNSGRLPGHPWKLASLLHMEYRFKMESVCLLDMVKKQSRKRQAGVRRGARIGIWGVYGGGLCCHQQVNGKEKKGT